MSEITDFLNARYTEEVAEAENATPGPWWYNPGKQWLDPDAFERYDLTQGEEFVGYGGPSPFVGAVAATGPANHPQSMRDAAYIARHHPARVLAEVEAKRGIIREAFHHAAKIDGEWGCCHSAEAIERGECEDYPPNGLAILRFLAAPYADHPDYDPIWTWTPKA